MNISKLGLLLSVILGLPNQVQARVATVSKLYCDQPTVNKKKEQLQLIIYATSDTGFQASVTFSVYKYIGKDSILLASAKSIYKPINEGSAPIKIIFKEEDSCYFTNATYLEILKTTNSSPEGTYKTFISVSDTLTKQKYDQIVIQYVDSSLSASSGIRATISNYLHKPHSGLLNRMTGKASKTNAKYSSALALSRSEKKISEQLKREGYTVITSETEIEKHLDIWKNDWYIGRYKIDKKTPVQDLVSSQDAIIHADQINGLTHNDFGNQTSLMSQFKTFKQQKENKKEIRGEIGVTTQLATAQEQASTYNNNYIETRGSIELPVMNIPLQLEWMYTTQDAGRQLKAGYFRVHYDVASLKDEMQSFIGGFNQKVMESKSKAIGTEQIYSSAIASMEAQKKSLEKELQHTAEQPDISKERNELTQQATNKISGKASTLKDSAQNKTGVTKTNADINSLKEQEAKVEKKKREILALTEKIEKYKQLLEQNKNARYYDSAIAYTKTQNLNYNDVDYKKLTAKGTDILPDGKVKKFATGLSSFDAGIFSKYASRYTLSGQNMKGVDVGYDFGGVETALTVGKVEYAGRDGSLDKYTCYMAQAKVKTAKEQTTTLVYYAYSPDKKSFLANGFVKDLENQVPSFYKPQQIVSVIQDGRINDIHYEVEAASIASDKHSSSSATVQDKSSLHLSIDGSIPTTSISLFGSFDGTGKSFENNTLAINRKGTNQYKIGGKYDLLKHKIAIAVDYNVTSIAATSGNTYTTKWGFDIKTKFKRYPNGEIAYKPFSTFRNFTDTSFIAQRPCFGEVWIGKGSYQFKHMGRAYLINLLYNKSISSSDSIFVSSETLQLTAMYTYEALNASISLGQAKNESSMATTINPASQTLIGLSTNYKVSEIWTLGGSNEWGVTKNRLSKLALNVNAAYNPKKYPYTVRFMLRGMGYESFPDKVWKDMYQLGIDFQYRFKIRVDQRK